MRKEYVFKDPDNIQNVMFVLASPEVMKKSFMDALLKSETEKNKKNLQDHWYEWTKIEAAYWHLKNVSRSL